MCFGFLNGFTGLAKELFHKVVFDLLKRTNKSILDFFIGAYHTVFNFRFNLMAHIQEKHWHFLIRIQDILHSRGIAAGLSLPDTDEFDIPIHLSLTTKGTNEVKQLCKDRNKYRFIPSTVAFDYLPKKNRKHDLK